ncbi:MAG: alpha/beta hydrolase-fold protein, partial [bacterium]
MTRALLIAGLTTLLLADQPYYDRSHFSKTFGEMRKYRIFLPPDYTSSSTRYPVIYYFHGHSDRYTLEKYDNGLDTVPKIEGFVAKHDAIVVAVDGYVARDYTGFYGGTPYDVRQDGGDFDFGAYFLELVQHIDSTYRTLSSRRYRATSGLSMGGFMSLYLSARYPDVIGSASAFNPGPEFYAGEKSRRSLWRPKDHVLSHEETMIRLVRASGDYISQYTEETRSAYARTPSVDFEFRQDEYHRHWATSIGETFEFHMRAFANPALDATPVEWNYASVFDRFHVRNYGVETDIVGPAFVYLRHIRQGGMGIRTRRWAPDGPPAACSAIHVQTAPLYKAGAAYQVTDYDLKTGRTSRSEAHADGEGRLQVALNCDGHELGFGGPGTGDQPPVLLPVTPKDVLRVLPGRSLSLPVRIFNPRETPLRNLRAELTSEYPTVAVLRGKAEAKDLAPGQTVDLSSAFEVRFTAGDGDFAHARLKLTIGYDGGPAAGHDIDVLIAPDHMHEPLEVAVLDGSRKTFMVFRQKGNQGGGAAIQRTVSEGKGNGNGALEPGEQATIWLRHTQGLDPADKNNWCRAKVYSDSPWLNETADIQEQKQLEWTSALNRTSLL